MKIEFNSGVDFDSLYVGDFFLDSGGELYLKIYCQDEYNAISLKDIQDCEPALHSFPSGCKCKKCEGKIVIS